MTGETANRTRNLLVGLAMLLAAVATWFAVHRYDRAAVIETMFNRLTLFHGLRRTTLEDYMRSKGSDVRAMSRNRRVIDAFVQFREAWTEIAPAPADRLRGLYIDGNPFAAGKRHILRSAGDGSRYSDVHKEFHDWARRFLEHFDYYDLFLIDGKGDILYTVNKGDDFGTNLADGPYDSGPLGFVFQQAARQGGNRVTFSDFETYAPAGGRPAAFAGSAIVDKEGAVIGVFAVQLNAEPINDILAYTGGMGETGQTYIVGNDLLMRSQSRFIAEPTMLSTVVDTESVRKGLGGFSGSLIGHDYRGVRVLSVYSALDFGGAPWVLLAEMEEREVLQRILRWRALLAGLAAALIAAALAHLAFRFHAKR